MITADLLATLEVRASEFELLLLLGDPGAAFWCAKLEGWDES